jgi:iron complex transport system substrate-binding protein
MDCHHRSVDALRLVCVNRTLLLLGAAALLFACEQDSENTTNSTIATRVVALAPHLAELTYSAGAGDLLVGVSAYSNYPPAATQLPVVGDAFTVDQEKLALLAPDLLLAWKSGTPTHVVEELRRAGYRVETIRTRGLRDISAAILRIGELTGRDADARRLASEFERSLLQLENEYSTRAPIRVFYQVAARPLYTISEQHYIGEILQLCGGRNIFTGIGELAPSVTVEAVVDNNPEVFLAGNADGNMPFGDWQRWPQIDANRYKNWFVVDADEVGRATTRLQSAAADVCEHLETARKNRMAYGDAALKKLSWQQSIDRASTGLPHRTPGARARAQ